jgi:hypothetical protein
MPVLASVRPLSDRKIDLWAKTRELVHASWDAHSGVLLYGGCTVNPQIPTPHF